MEWHLQLLAQASDPEDVPLAGVGQLKSTYPDRHGHCPLPSSSYIPCFHHIRQSPDNASTSFACPPHQHDAPISFTTNRANAHPFDL